MVMLQICTLPLCPSCVVMEPGNSCLSATIRFKNDMVDYNEIGGLTGPSLVLIHYIGTEESWQIKVELK